MKKAKVTITVAEDAQVIEVIKFETKEEADKKWKDLIKEYEFEFVAWEGKNYFWDEEKKIELFRTKEST